MRPSRIHSFPEETRDAPDSTVPSAVHTNVAEVTKNILEGGGETVLSAAARLINLEDKGIKKEREPRLSDQVGWKCWQPV